MSPARKVADPGPDDPPSWYAASAPAPKPHPPLQGERDCDVAIVGGGLTGLSAALHLAARGYDTVLLEQHRIAWGASGRNGGQVHSGQRRNQNWLERNFGFERARRLWRMAEEAKALVRELAERHAIDCDIAPGLLNGDHRARYVEATRAYVHLLRERYGYRHARFIGRDEMRELVATTDYHGGWLDEGAFHLDPLKLSLGLARAALKAGVDIHERTPVRDIEPGAGVRLSTPQGRVLARTVIVACNGHLAGLCPPVERHVMPINSFIAATEPLGAERARALIRDNLAVSDSRFVVNYYRLTPDHRLLFGGGEAYTSTMPRDIAGIVRKRMLHVLPQLTDVAIDHAWGGTLAVTTNRMFHARRVGPSILAVAGYSGQGLALALLAGKIMAEAVDGEPERFDFLADLPQRAFPGGTSLRAPLLALAMGWYATLDRI